MDGFKSNPKMQCFKEGGQVKYETRKEHAEEIKADINQDKQIVKKAIKMHDTQEHKGEKTDLSKLKKGGRAKKDCGTVRKYKTGGSITNVYEAKKSSGDLDNIKKTKDIKPVKLCGGKSVKKYAEGGSIDDDVRARAMRWIEAGSPEQAEAPSAAVKPSRPKKVAKLPMPDYSNEDLDRIDAELAATAERKKARFSPSKQLGLKVAKVPEYAKELTGYKAGKKVC